MRRSGHFTAAVLAAVGALVLVGCNSDALPTASVMPSATPGDCGAKGEIVQSPAQYQVLTPADVPSGLRQISAQPMNLGVSPTGEAVSTNSYQVVFTDPNNSERIVSQVVVAATPSKAELLLEGATSNLKLNQGTSLGTAPMCPSAQLATLMQGGKPVYAVSWRHNNVFAEVVLYHTGVSNDVVIAEVEDLASKQEAKITKAAAATPAPTAVATPG